jgi:rhamnosyltransferase subunit B
MNWTLSCFSPGRARVRGGRRTHFTQPARGAADAEGMAQKLVFNGTGTRGDLLPMLAMAAEMQGRGHACHVLGNDSVAGLAGQLGVPFTSVAPAQTNNLTSVEENFGKYVFAAYPPTFDFFEKELKRGTDMVVVNPEHYAASTLMAERHGLPLCRFTLTPYRMRSLAVPHWPWSERARGRLGCAFRRYVLPGLYEQRYANPYIVAGVNEFRKGLGLAPISSLRSLDRLVTHQVCLFPEWYCPRAPDWPSELSCVGFPLAPPSGELAAEVRLWIERHGKPIVFTPGTGVVDVDKFFDAARTCCQLLKLPGLFLSPSFDTSRLDPAEPILHLSYLDLALVLPHAALLVHHGGIGTTARALEAEVPQIISPQAFDQPDNGHRVSQLGAGTMIGRNRLSGEALAQAARWLLDGEGTRRTLRELGCRVREAHAIPAMADILERRFIHRAPRPAPRANRHTCEEHSHERYQPSAH